VLDLCTGSGALAVAIKKLSPLCLVTAADISKEALAIAKQNAAMNKADVRFVQGDLWEAVPNERFSVIVSNPPYIPSGELPALQEEVRREPSLALDGGADGLNFYRRIIEGAPAHLEAGGALLLETGDGESEAVAQLMAKDFENIRTVNDLNDLPRVVLGTLRHMEDT
jgi:release factor glutamine methyltransferase